MKTSNATRLVFVLGLIAGLCGIDSASGNGGPFVVKYPKGDPAAKGVLARLDPTLKPKRETRLRVVKEDLTISFNRDKLRKNVQMPPLTSVRAVYTIENPTDREVQVDFGFPILRGIHLGILSMKGRLPSVSVKADNKPIRQTIISNSLIYGIIRQRARETIGSAVAGNPLLARLVANVRRANVSVQQNLKVRQAAVQQRSFAGRLDSAASARKKLSAYLTGRLKWNERDAALMVEYAALDFGKMKSRPRDRRADLLSMMRLGKKAKELLTSNLGPLSAIGEQKATQFLAQLAGRFDKDAGAAYEAIFKAWGGDVRERAIDLDTGKVRPRRITDLKADAARITGDVTIYARVDYLDANAKLTEAQKASCKAVLKNLPVVFTFAPMNLLHYQVKFPARSKRVVTVAYQQYAYVDTGKDTRPSYQLAYVLHPASLWDDFGPINLKVQVPKGVTCRASVPMKKSGQTYEATLADARAKTGELFIGLDKAGWDAQFNPAGPKKLLIGGIAAGVLVVAVGLVLIFTLGPKDKVPRGKGYMTIRPPL